MPVTGIPETDTAPDVAGRVELFEPLVELAEQGRLLLMTNIVNCEVERVHIGMNVRVLFRPRGPVWLPLFEPVPG